MKRNTSLITFLSAFCFAFPLISCSTTFVQPEDNDEEKEEKEQEEQDPEVDPEEEETIEEDTSIVLPAIDYVKVFAPKDKYSHIYAWTSNGELLGGWPGKTMVEADDFQTTTKWNTYDFKDNTSFNLIFSNNGNNQTSDLSVSRAGYYWYYNNSLVYTNIVPETGGEVTSNDIPVPTSNYVEVDKAKNSDELPAVKNYNKGQVISPYLGNRDDFRDESIYFAITTRFYDGDSKNNRHCWDGNNNDDDPAWRGDFKGLIQKMDYIKALGFTAIWITPINKNASGYDYHGYHAINFKEVDPRYESNDVKFIDVIKEAHNRDMKIILDVVFNHTCNYGEENLFPMFYYDSKNNPTINGLSQNYDSSLLPSNYSSLNGGEQYNTRLRTIRGEKDTGNVYHHEWNMEYEQFIEQTGSLAGDCMDLNTENPSVANYLVESFGEFIHMGVDAFRIDTMKHISRLTFNTYIWPGLYKIAEKCGNKHFYMFGEVCNLYHGTWNHEVPSDSAAFYTWKETKSYKWGDRLTNEESTKKHWDDNLDTTIQPTSNNALLGSNYSYHTPDYSKSSNVGVIDFGMHWAFKDAPSAYQVSKNDQYYNDATYNVVYVDSHDYGPDQISKVRYNQGTEAWKENMSLMFTFRGIPCIYYGSEVEFQKGKTIDAGSSILLKDSGRAYYGDYLEGNVNVTDFGEYTASGTISNTLNSVLSKHLQILNKVRLKVPALRRGQYQKGSSDLSFVRRYTTNELDSLAVISISNNASFNNLPNGRYVDLISGDIKNVTNGQLNISISSKGDLAIYVLDNGSSGTLTKIK